MPNGGATCRDRRGHVIVCGLHGLGLRIVEQLRAAGESVVVVDDEADIRVARVVIGWGVPHISGNAAIAETLTDAGIAGAAAMICVEQRDLANLEISLLARELRPDLRVVTHIRNGAVGRALAAGEEAGAVLDVAALSTPSMVEALLRSTVHELEMGGTRFLVAGTRAARAGTLRERYGDLTPVVTRPAAGGEPEICPGRDHRVAAGDRVTLLGTAAELRAHGVAADGPAPAAGRARVTRDWLRALLRGFDDSGRGLRRALTTLASLVALSTVVLWLGYEEPGMSPLDGLYFSIETIATVGFGDFSFAEQPLWLRSYAIGLMILGVTNTAVLLAYITDLLISRRLERSFGRRLATRLSGHIVLVGLGTVGAGVMNELRARGYDVVVVERDERGRFLTRARELGVPVLFGDATVSASLAAANLRRAAAVAVLTSDDMINIEVGLAIRDLLGERWTEIPVVLRLFDRTMARTLSRRFGFEEVRSTAELAAPWFVGAALGLDVLGTFTAQRLPFMAGRLTVAPGGGLDGLTLEELPERTRVAAVRRGDGGGDGDGGERGDPGALEHPPRRSTRLRRGDQAYVVGPYEELLGVLRRGRTADSSVGPAADR